ncbi:MAG: hypothetical protein ACK5O1_07835 [Holosporales bacterium]|jgi:hypothetical protein
MKCTVLNQKITTLWLDILAETQPEIFIDNVRGWPHTHARELNKNAIVPYVVQSILLGKSLQEIIESTNSILLVSSCKGYVSEWPTRTIPIGEPLKAFVTFLYLNLQEEDYDKSNIKPLLHNRYELYLNRHVLPGRDPQSPKAAKAFSEEIVNYIFGDKNCVALALLQHMRHNDVAIEIQELRNSIGQ